VTNALAGAQQPRGEGFTDGQTIRGPLLSYTCVSGGPSNAAVAHRHRPPAPSPPSLTAALLPQVALAVARYQKDHPSAVVRVTGHSLGGALAVLAALDLVQRG
jgi:hypothetical protein